MLHLKTQIPPSWRCAIWLVCGALTRVDRPIESRTAQDECRGAAHEPPLSAADPLTERLLDAKQPKTQDQLRQHPRLASTARLTLHNQAGGASRVASTIGCGGQGDAGSLPLATASLLRKARKLTDVTQTFRRGAQRSHS
jgi:hypothetical protein